MNGPVTLTGWVDYIQRQHWRTMDLTLERICEVWKRMGGKITGKVIAIAGTNGKGSCVAMLESVFIAKGVTTGSYTSPHLVRFNERIRVNGNAVDDAVICAAFEQINAARKASGYAVGLTYFEFATLCALHIFQESAVDVLLLETGMGGRLDAVNMIANDLALVTNIGLDHQAWLGDTREEIAVEKAGIVKVGGTVICCDRDLPATFVRQVQDKNAEMLLIGRDFDYEVHSPQSRQILWSLTAAARRDGWSAPLSVHAPFAGQHQLENLSGVMAVLSRAGEWFAIAPEDLSAGLEAATVSARCEIANENPVVILDVAHNGDSAQQLGQFLKSLDIGGETLGVIGVLADKNPGCILAPLADRIDRWYLASLPAERGQGWRELRDKMAAVLGEFPHQGFSNPASAYRAAIKSARTADCVVVFGSFHTVGDIIALREVKDPG